MSDPTHYETDCFCEGPCVCDEYAEQEQADWTAEEQAAYEAGEAAFLAEMEASTVMQSDLTDDEVEAAIAAAEAHYDATVNR